MATFSAPTLPARLAGSAVTVVDCHVGGEIARIVVGGLPAVPGDSMAAKREAFMTDPSLASLARRLLTEPRGSPPMNVDYVFPSATASSTYGIVISEQADIWPSMSGHNLIGTCTAIVEMGMVAAAPPTTDGTATFSVETPGGLVDVTVTLKAGKVEAVEFLNLPAFVGKAGVGLDVPELGLPGPLPCDIVFGGMWYVVVSLDDIPGLEYSTANAKALATAGEAIKVAAKRQSPVEHPTLDYPGPDILVFRAGTSADGVNRNTVVMSCGDGGGSMLDRSPCGTGTTSVIALLHSQGKLGVGEAFVHESIVGSRFTGRVVAETTVGDTPAVSVAVAGTGHIIALATIVTDPTDPFPNGFTMSDVWPTPPAAAAAAKKKKET